MSTGSHSKKIWASVFAFCGRVARSRTLLSGSLVLLANVAGCTIYGPTARNALYEPRLLFDETTTYVRDCFLADSTWREFRKANPESYSGDYAHGFKAGFKAFLKYGERTGMPAIPPKYYWWTEKEGPGEMARVEDWHAGFVRGVETARTSGFRELTVVPALVPGLKAPDDTISLLTSMINGPRVNAQDASGDQPADVAPRPSDAPGALPSDKTAPVLPIDQANGKPKQIAPAALKNQ